MKFYAHLLALCAVSGTASAFVVQPTSLATKSSSTTSLASSRRDGGSSSRRRSERQTLERSRSSTRRSSPSVSGGALDRGRRREERRSYNSPVSRNRRAGDRPSVDDDFRPITVQGGSLETWSFPSPVIDRVHVHLETEGRPLNANVELWQGPDNCPQKVGVYLEDASVRPFNAVIATPRGSNAIAIRNTGMLEFPMTAAVQEDRRESGMWDFEMRHEYSRVVQGGAVYTEPFPPGVESVQLMLKTDGRPLNARIELLQGPNNNKAVMEVYTEDGWERPFLCVMDTPETGNVVRIVNTATVEFPLTAMMEPFQVEAGYDPDRDYGYSNQNRLDGSSTGGSTRGYNGMSPGLPNTW